MMKKIAVLAVIAGAILAGAPAGAAPTPRKVCTYGFSSINAGNGVKVNTNTTYCPGRLPCVWVTEIKPGQPPAVILKTAGCMFAPRR